MFRSIYIQSFKPISLFSLLIGSLTIEWIDYTFGPRHDNKALLLFHSAWFGVYALNIHWITKLYTYALATLLVCGCLICVYLVNIRIWSKLMYIL